ncbi:MAG: hypothetical protein M1829_006948 [Trizodia sp. TS-e1964]|nr:MAG: hypothetical protein M1829_006948 [Trizodia sp. TS-e1964]
MSTTPPLASKLSPSQLHAAHAASLEYFALPDSRPAHLRCNANGLATPSLPSSKPAYGLASAQAHAALQNPYSDETSPRALHGPNIFPSLHHSARQGAAGAEQEVHSISSNSLSPSTPSINNQPSPTAGYLSDNGFSEISEHTTPSFDDDVFALHFHPVSVLGADDLDAFSSFTHPDTVAYQKFDFPVSNIFSSQSPELQKQASLGTATSSSYLISPVHTNFPSPSGRPFHEASAADPAVIHDGLVDAISMMDFSTQRQGIEWTAMHQGAGLQNPQTTQLPSSNVHFSSEPLHHPHPHHMSPIVRVENYGHEEPVGSALDQNPGKRSHSAIRATGHLSPHPPSEDSSDDECEPDHPSSSPAQARRTPASRSPPRAADGSWILNAATGHAGVGPDARAHLNSTTIPTLKEQEETRQIAERNADVAQWLEKSEHGSIAGDDPHPAPSGRTRKAKSGHRRRAKSMGDPVTASHFDALGLDLAAPAPDDSGIPGPGVLLDEESGDDEDGADDYDSEIFDDSPPASAHEAQQERPASSVGNDEEEPGPHRFVRARPWHDPTWGSTVSSRHQPDSSNAAMARFRRRAENIETASRAATWGTRRLSEGDVGKLMGPGGLLKQLSFGKDKDKKEPRERRPSGFFEMTAKKLIPKRSGSNLKRKGSGRERVSPAADQSDRTKGEAAGGLAPPQRMGSLGRPKSPKLSTGIAVAAMAGQIAAIGGSISANTAPQPSGPWIGRIIKRTRSTSKAESGRRPYGDSNTPGLSELMTSIGGPPMPTLASPPKESENAKPSPPPLGKREAIDEDSNDDALMAEAGVKMDLQIRPDPIIPTPAGFQANVCQLNPRLAAFLVERISHEQTRRYKKLVEYKVAHLNAINSRKCSSGAFCFSLGGEAKILPARSSNRDPENSFAGFNVSKAGASDEEDNTFGEGAVTEAQFPQGVPLPPVKRLPAEFECSLCFKVKKFQKPSDWTKHVHEDVQPFTCTFPNCAEPKSFKRKADWVRHENERHRQLEWWTCNLPDCSHTCYRKDNFVQHLVREHKKPEPKVKATKAAAKAGRSRAGKNPMELIEAWKATVPAGEQDTTQDEIDKVWALVEECRHETTKKPGDEPCKFCGNICNSWKKLTVHLARHMEQISLPVLTLIDQSNITANTILSPIEHRITRPSAPNASPPLHTSATRKLERPNMASYPPPNPPPRPRETPAHYAGLQGGANFYPNATASAQVSSYDQQNSIYTTQVPGHASPPLYPNQSGVGFTTAAFTQFNNDGTQHYVPTSSEPLHPAIQQAAFANYDTMPSHVAGPSMTSYGPNGTPIAAQSLFSSPVEGNAYLYHSDGVGLQEGLVQAGTIDHIYGDLSTTTYTTGPENPASIYMGSASHGFSYQNS